jgi:hypothetical protein
VAEGSERTPVGRGGQIIHYWQKNIDVGTPRMENTDLGRFSLDALSIGSRSFSATRTSRA